MIRVFPRRTKLTPDDPLAFVGDPPMGILERLGRDHVVNVSCTFTWDRPEAERLLRAWRQLYPWAYIGGPAFGSGGGKFTPGQFVKKGSVITSRGCIRKCSFCLVPEREGSTIRELGIRDGFNVLDNNLLACSRNHIVAVFDMLRRQKERAVFSGGLDARLLKPWHVELLKSIRVDQMFFACDSEGSIRDLRRVAELMTDFSREKKRCYVLIGFDGETPKQAEARLKEVFALDFLPFAMLYRGVDATGRNSPEFHGLAGKWRAPRAYKMEMEGPKRPRKGGRQLGMQA